MPSKDRLIKHVLWLSPAKMVSLPVINITSLFAKLRNFASVRRSTVLRVLEYLPYNTVVICLRYWSTFQVVLAIRCSLTLLVDYFESYY